MPGAMDLIERRGKMKGTGFMRYEKNICICSNVMLARSRHDRKER